MKRTQLRVIKDFLNRYGHAIALCIVLAIMFSTQCGCVTTESSKQTADYIWKGASAIDKATPGDSPIKPDTKSLKRLAKAHSQKELGAPEAPLADDWNPEIADKKSEQIDNDYATWGLWLGGIGLLLFTVSRTLKAVGIYLPEAWAKDALATLFKPPVKPEEKVEPPPETVPDKTSIIKDCEVVDIPPTIGKVPEKG